MGLVVKEIVFPAGPDSVAIAGSFNAWQPTHQMERQPDGSFTTTIQTHSEPHQVRFKFIINKTEWISSSDYPVVADGYGGCNNFVVVTDTDLHAVTPPVDYGSATVCKSPVCANSVPISTRVKHQRDPPSPSSPMQERGIAATLASLSKTSNQAQSSESPDLMEPIDRVYKGFVEFSGETFTTPLTVLLKATSDKVEKLLKNLPQSLSDVRGPHNDPRNQPDEAVMLLAALYKVHSREISDHIAILLRIYTFLLTSYPAVLPSMGASNRPFLAMELGYLEGLMKEITKIQEAMPLSSDDAFYDSMIADLMMIRAAYTNLLPRLTSAWPALEKERSAVTKEFNLLYFQSVSKTRHPKGIQLEMVRHATDQDAINSPAAPSPSTIASMMTAPSSPVAASPSTVIHLEAAVPADAVPNTDEPECPQSQGANPNQIAPAVEKLERQVIPPITVTSLSNYARKCDITPSRPDLSIVIPSASTIAARPPSVPAKAKKRASIEGPRPALSELDLVNGERTFHSKRHRPVLFQKTLGRLFSHKNKE
ncbi:hypothetical protein SeMB42_g07848 [Synchytrium endobioticum]|uniref:AMP-activated protein kinase glycogen-binding domain-containing protein n=1 Tax=Synchytrium endobioticum TaxID=286115 RepID=A0A507BVD3_9FUNG|nr:hypothetical protein SeMB42_g07848 [Synchytrium endobioticum]